MHITWHLYRTKQGAWVVYSDTPVTFTAPDRNQVEKRLTKLGVRQSEITQLFDDEEKNGEGIITVPIGLERLHEDGLLPPD
jgi:hypothetical protein